jgi:hypothetical protein
MAFKTILINAIETKFKNYFDPKIYLVILFFWINTSIYYSVVLIKMQFEIHRMWQIKILLLKYTFI